jgi:DNA primase
VALTARYISDAAPLRMRTLGPAGDGVFAAPCARTTPLVAIAEAPIDALSLAAAGVPAIALGGTKNRPAWLRRRLAEHPVLLATDADAAGDIAAQDLARWLSFGTRCRRLRPPADCKDWNEVLQARGLAALVQLLTPLVADGGADV